MKITVYDLESRRACKEGVDAFRSFFPHGWEGEWDAWAQAICLMDPELRKYVGWAVEKGLISWISMAGWNLKGANLKGANLEGADLVGANLWGANLRGANLE